MNLALAAAIAAVIALPHALPLTRAHPLSASTLWASALALRALSGVIAAAYVVVFVPTTDTFAALTSWRWHDVLPFVPAHVDLTGHGLGDLATIAPSAALAISLLWVGVGVIRAARLVHRRIVRTALGRGPRDSVIVGGAEIVVAAAGLRRPQLLLSAGALLALADDELDAGLDHERGHIARGHRYVLVIAQLCRAVGGFLPGTALAVRELAFHLERDADRWALRRGHERRALAGAICKAAMSQLVPTPAITPLAGSSVVDRVAELLEDDAPPRPASSIALGVLAGAIAVVTVALWALVPGIVGTGTAGGHIDPVALARCALSYSV